MQERTLTVWPLTETLGLEVVPTGTLGVVVDPPDLFDMYQMLLMLPNFPSWPLPYIDELPNLIRPLPALEDGSAQ